MIRLKSQRIIYQNHVNSVRMSGESCDQELAADSIHRFAVEAFSGFLQGVLMSNLWALAVAATFLARFIALSRSGQTFVYTYNKDYIFFRTLGYAGDTVGIAINIDKDTIICDCIGTG